MANLDGAFFPAKSGGFEQFHDWFRSRVLPEIAGEGDVSGGYLVLAGKAGGQTAYGDTASGGSLTIGSTAHAVKGKIFLGASSAYDEANVRLGIGTTSPSDKLHIVGDMVFDSSAPRNIHTSGADGANTYLRMYAGSGALSGTPQGGALQFFANTSVLPGQVYIDSGSHASGAIILRAQGAATAATERVRINSSGNIAFWGSAATGFGGSSRIFFIGNSSGAPGGSPSGGGWLYAAGGALWWIGSSGTATEIAPA